MEAQRLVEDGLLTVEDAAAFLGVKRSFLYSLMSSGRLPFVKIGKARRVPRRALVELAAEHLRGGWARDNGGVA